MLQPIGRIKRKQLYDTIRDAVLTTAQKLTWVSLIYRTEPTSNKRKTEKSTKDYARNCVSLTSLCNEWSQSRRRKAGKTFSKCLNEAYSLFIASALLCRRFYPVQTNHSHTHTHPFSFFQAGCFLPPNQQRQSTEVLQTNVICKLNLFSTTSSAVYAAWERIHRNYLKTYPKTCLKNYLKKKTKIKTS